MLKRSYGDLGSIEKCLRNSNLSISMFVSDLRLSSKMLHCISWLDVATVLLEEMELAKRVAFVSIPCLSQAWMICCSFVKNMRAEIIHLKDTKM